jgi:hypothetical protein
MNFEHMPELHYPHAYAIFWAATSFIVSAQLLVFWYAGFFQLMLPVRSNQSFRARLWREAEEAEETSLEDTSDPQVQQSATPLTKPGRESRGGTVFQRTFVPPSSLPPATLKKRKVTQTAFRSFDQKNGSHPDGIQMTEIH